MKTRVAVPCTLLATLMAAPVVVAQRGKDPISAEHAAIQYKTRPTTDPVAELNRRIQNGEVQLQSDSRNGYLKSVLDALKVPVESQVLVFSETSLQSDFITQAKPRAVYFNDTAMVGWVQGADTLEAVGVDPQQGVVFYQLGQAPVPNAHFGRSQRCLECHEAASTRGVPGLVLMSMLPMTDDPNEYAVGWSVDHRTPVEDRWGGWFVTGVQTPTRHLGNVPVYHVKKAGVRAAIAPKLLNLKTAIDSTPYLTPYSDIVAQLVLNHQVTMVNMVTRLNWTARIADYERSAGRELKPSDGGTEPVADMAAELVDYMLFIDEAPLPAHVQGSSGFTEKFTALGPRDRKGRSLRDLDLQKRLMRYPCSYLIYSPAFDALPAHAKSAVYTKLARVLTGRETDHAYQRLTAADRQAIIEILRDTKKDLPRDFPASAQ
jgi:hypothetical protein